MQFDALYFMQPWDFALYFLHQAKKHKQQKYNQKVVKKQLNYLIEFGSVKE